MKRLYILIASAALLASCSVNVGDDPIKNPKSGNPEAVNFSIYVNKSASTKAGMAGELTTDRLKEADGGFGVFAYYGNGALYNETSKPDFMYDQQVTYNTTNNVWGYSPVKYWPNEFGEAASSEAADRLTFFAYAPFADVTPSTGVVTGDATTGIIGMSRNISAGDPVVMYSSSLKPGAGVDLCWGVAADAFTSSVDGDNNNVAAGYPFLNVIKPKTGDHLKFEFNHALAQLNVQIDADINNEVAGDSYTKIYVRSVTFNGFSMRGSLNLNSNKTEGPIWYDISGTGKLKREPVTVYDGRTDGMEGVATASDVSEKPADMNPVIVQDKPYGDAQLSAGVTATAVNLFNGAADAPVMVIPTPGVPVTVTIVYDVETEDNRLTGYLSDGVTHGSRVENKITKTITTDQGNMILSAGKKYVVKLHLGLTSVKFDADVAIWDNTSYPNPVDVNLPDNSGITPPTPPTPTAASFRGYEVSKGLLERTVVSSEASYSLTTGDNQFEILGYYGIDENRGKYYHQWTKLKEELGSDADGNIDASSNKLPDGWTMPGSAEWEEIVFGDATGITVNGQAVSYGYALVSVTVGTQTIPALMLVPDNTAIVLASLIGAEDLFDEKVGEYGYEEIYLSSDDYTYLMGNDCRFLPISGCFDNVVNHAWKHGMEDVYPEGYYWGYDHHQLSQGQAYFLWVDYDDEWADITTITALSDYYPVRLVKKIN